MNFSCIILTKNEERDIGRCLDSVSDCDDIFIVDSGSTDNTRKAADESPARFTWVENRPEGQYAAASQRNWALDNLTLKHEWVLFLDADEMATKDFLADVTTAISRAPAGTDGGLCCPKFMYHGRWLKNTKKFPTWEPRLLRHNSIRLVDGTWERFPEDSKVFRVMTPYIHYANSKGLDAWVSKHLLYASWEARTEGRHHESTASLSRRIARLLGPVRPAAVLLWFLIVRRSFLDGIAGLSYARRMFIYELLIRERRAEALIEKRGEPL